MICCYSITSEVIRDIIVSLAAVCGVIFTYFGVKEWKRRNVGEEKIKFALKGLTLTNQLKEESIRIRNRASFFYNQLFPSDEVINSIVKEHNNDPKKVISSIMKYMSENGLKEVTRLHDELDEHTMIVEALTDGKIREVTDALLKTVRTLLFNIRKYIEREYDPDAKEYLDIKEIHDIVFLSGKDDKFLTRLQDESSAVKKIYLSIIKKA